MLLTLKVKFWPKSFVLKIHFPQDFDFEMKILDNKLELRIQDSGTIEEVNSTSTIKISSDCLCAIITELTKIETLAFYSKKTVSSFTSISLL